MTLNAYAQYRNDAFLPHIANGSFDRGSYRTTFILFNNTDNNDSALLRLTDNDGKLLTVTIPGLGSGSEFAVDLPPGATRIFQTDGSGGLLTGAATVTSSSAIGLSAIFSVYDTSGNFLTESGVGDSPAVSDFVIPVDVTGDFNTGLALLNPAQVETSVSLTLMDSNGNEVATTNRTIAAGGHLATFVAGPGQLFPSTTTFRGMLAVSSTGAIAALTLRQNGTPLSYTSLPVVPPYGAQTHLYLPHVANGSYGGGSFKTSFIFMNPQAMPANVRLSLATSGGTPFQVALPGKDTGSSFDFKLEHNASVILQTDGSGPLTVGTATIESDVPIGASGIFTVLDAQGRFQTEAGVGASTEVSGATLPVDVTGKFDTGVAFLNTSSTTVQLTLTLLNENGEVLQGSKKIPLPGMNHTAKFVSELFPGTANFRGSLVVSGASVVALTLRQNSLPLSYTTLPVRQGVSHGKILPLLTQTKTGIAATGDVVVNATLAAGFKLAGRIDGPGYLAQVAAQSSTGEVFAGRFGYSLSGPKYLLVLPAGAYTLKVCYQAQGGYANITFTDPNPVQVTADTTRDITLPPASLTDISGTVSGLSNLPPLLSKSIVFNSMDNSVWVQLRLEDDGKYSGKITPGSYRANLYLPNVKFQDGHIQDPLTIFNFGAVNVGSSPVVANFTLPPLANLSGRVSGTDISLAGVYATDRSAPAMAYDACGYFPAYSITGIDPSGQFQLTLVKDRAYDIQVEQYFTRYGGVYYGTVRYPVPASVVNLSSDGRLDISAPSLPDGVVISGKVTDSAGRPVGNVEVEVVSQSLTGVINATLSRWELTDSDGNYRMLVLSGTNYKLTFYPPIPAP
jgi:hypothetical protein